MLGFLYEMLHKDWPLGVTFVKSMCDDVLH